ncbi:MAG: Lrp/AsnC family transcriptional regulator, partial [Methanosarcinales archaeon]|nr:Lrp/AsnC family transcriptional regulator [Methanosarcinales archaeon]
MEEIEERALGLIRRSKDGILQNQLRLELGVDGRRCARIVRTLLDAKMAG